MSEQIETNSASMDLALLAKLTGGLGYHEIDREDLQRVRPPLQRILPDVFHSETNISINVTYAGFKSGLMRDLWLISEIRSASPMDPSETGVQFRPGLRQQLRDCPDGADAGCRSRVDRAATERPLSDIELDLASHGFRARCKRSAFGVNAPGGFRGDAGASHTMPMTALPRTRKPRWNSAPRSA